MRVIFLNNGIYFSKEYGSIKLHLAEMMQKRGMKRNQLARLIGSRFEVVDNWCQGSVERLDLDVLARICCVLDCSVSDLLEYVKE